MHGPFEFIHCDGFALNLRQHVESLKPYLFSCEIRNNYLRHGIYVESSGMLDKLHNQKQGYFQVIRRRIIFCRQLHAATISCCLLYKQIRRHALGETRDNPIPKP